jgi:hypothetical protein
VRWAVRQRVSADALLREGMGAEPLRRGAVSAGPLGRERMSADALLREMMRDAALRRGAMSAGAPVRERMSADALPREVKFLRGRAVIISSIAQAPVRP